MISRATAKARGLLRYFTGRPCPRGHVTERYVSSHGCMECVRLFKQSPNGRAIDSRSHKSVLGKESKRRYDQSVLGLECAHRYNNSPLGQETSHRQRLKRNFGR
jgi:hypothetical protein